MAKIIKILAVSLGSGLVLGAGIRALESRAPRSEDFTAPFPPQVPPSGPAREGNIEEVQALLLDRINGIERRLDRMAPAASDGDATSQTAEPGAETVGLDAAGAGRGKEFYPVAALYARLDARKAESETILARLANAEKTFTQAHENSERLGLEMREWLAEDIRRRMTEVENRLSANLEGNRRETLEALADGVQVRVGERISKLEKEVTGQAASMEELRDCSLKTEQSIQKLLGAIDRLVVAQNASRGIQTKREVGPMNGSSEASARESALEGSAPAPVESRAEPSMTGPVRAEARDTLDDEERDTRPQRRRWNLFS